MGTGEMLTKRMEHELWVGRLDELLAAWRDAGPHSETEFLRSFHHLLQNGRAAAELLGVRVPESNRFDHLLDVAAFHTAVLEFLTETSAYMMSRGSDGIHMATVILTVDGVEATATARTCALAVAGAILLALGQGVSHEKRTPSPSLSSSQ
jgi:hypothetical protein